MFALNSVSVAPDLTQLFLTARCSGVSPLLFLMSVLAPLSIRKLTRSDSSIIAAMCSPVFPSPSVSFASWAENRAFASSYFPSRISFCMELFSDDAHEASRSAAAPRTKPIFFIAILLRLIFRNLKISNVDYRMNVDRNAILI